jgi:hypothetical protein
MRSISVAVLIFAVWIPAASAAESQTDDKSYLPPASMRAAPQAVPAARAQAAGTEGRRRQVKVVTRRYRESRGYRERRFAGPRMFFGFF